MNGWLADLSGVLARPGFVLEILLVLGLVGLAGLVTSLFQRRQIKRRGVPVRGVGLLFPLLAILLLTACGFLVHHFGSRIRLVNVAVQLMAALAAVRIVEFAIRRAFSQATWVAIFARTLATLIWAGVALDLLGILPELVEWLDGFAFRVGRAHLTLWSILQGSASVLATLVVALWLGGLVETRLQESASLDASLKIVFARLAKAMLSLVAVLVGMGMVGLDLTALSVFGGALGVGLGFGMQKIASNYVSGFIILLDHSIRIGDLIQVGEERGEVKTITTRYTVLRAPNGSHTIVPNETLVGSTVQNDSFADPRMRIAMQLQVGYSSDVERAISILEELARAQARVLADPPPQAFVAAFDDSGIRLELAVWIADPENGVQPLRSDLYRATLARFRAAGIELPFPQREVRLLNASDVLRQPE